MYMLPLAPMVSINRDGDLYANMNRYIALVTNTATASFDVFNPIDATLEIEYVQADAKYQGQTYAQFAQNFNFAVPPGQTVNSGNFSPVVLTKGLVASIPIVGQPLDIFSGATTRVGENGAF